MDSLFFSKTDLTKSGSAFMSVIPIVVTYVLEPFIDFAWCQSVKKLQKFQINIKDQTDFQSSNWILIFSFSSFCLQDEPFWENFAFWTLYAFKYEIMCRFKVKWPMIITSIIVIEILQICVRIYLAEQIIISNTLNCILSSTLHLTIFYLIPIWHNTRKISVYRLFVAQQVLILCII